MKKLLQMFDGSSIILT